MASLLSTAGFSSVCMDSIAASALAASSLGLQNLQTHVCSLGFQNTHNYARFCGAGIDNICHQERFLVSAFKKRVNDKLPPGAFDMVDEETGERVIWLGIEGQEDKIPSDDMLQWEPVKYAECGDISDQAWLRMLQASPPTGETVYSSDVDMSTGSKSKKRDAVPKKSYPDVGSSKSKGLFSRLKVQNIRSQKDPGETGSRRTSTQEDLKILDSLEKDDELLEYASQKEASETSVREGKIDKDENKSQIVTKGGQNRTVEVSSVQNEGKSRSRASHLQKISREVVAKDFFSIKSFKTVGANEKVLQALQFMEMSRPSQIQALAYEPILNGRSCIVADQTGSGKTLAYLAPLFQRFLVEEEQGLSKSFPNRPRALVMVPTSELASQVLNVCRLLSKGGAPLKSMVATGGFRLKTQVEALENSADIAIATPGRFLQLLGAGSLRLDNLKSVVLDEVDVLFDDPEFSETLERVETLASVKTQYIHVTATLPVDVCDNILEKHPNSLALMGPGLHCTAAGLQEVLVDCSGEGEKNPETAYENKKKALLQLVEQQPVSKTIVFCNKIETCRKVENALKRLDRKGSRIDVLPYHAALSLEARLENMQKFMGTDSDRSVFLVCTDRASRGLDLVDVEHVVLFDFPRDPSEYVRRVGRTARAGGAGKAFVFVVGKQVSLARKIMIRNEKGHPIHSVPSHAY